MQPHDLARPTRALVSTTEQDANRGGPTEFEDLPVGEPAAGPERARTRLDAAHGSEVLEEIQLRTVWAGIIASMAVIALMAAYYFVPGHYPFEKDPFLGLVCGAGFAVLVGTVMPWRRLIARRAFVSMTFGWALADIALVSAGVAVSGGGRSEIYVLYLVMCVFMAGVCYPRRIRLVLSLLLIASYAITLSVVGWHLSAATILLRFGMIAITAGAADIVSMALTRELYFRAQATRQSDQRANMWSTVAALARQAGLLDESALLSWAVDAVREVGFEAANLCMFEPGSESYRVVEARGLPDEYVRNGQFSGREMALLVSRGRRTVVVGDDDEGRERVPVMVTAGFRTVVATPLWIEGEMGGVLVGATRSKRAVEPEEIAAVELLAAHAGHGLEAARKLEHQRRDAAHFRSVVTSAPDAMLVLDTEGVVLEGNHQVSKLFGYEPFELAGIPIDQLLAEPSRRFAQLYKDTFTQNPRSLVLGDSDEVLGLSKDGSTFPVEVVLGPIEAPEGLLVTATVRDVTERREFERRLAHQATHDHLTGLPNRAQFVGRLAEALTRTPPGSSQIAVCFLDVDHFKYVNDSRGHTVGDELVSEVARRIASTARAGDIVARFGGDEFAVLVEGLNDRQGAVAYAWRLLSTFDAPFILDNVECFLSASVGVAFGARGDNPNDLLRNADAAMYHAKQRGRARVELFDDTLTARAMERVEIESALHQALLGEQLSLVYQPVLHLPTRSIVGVESLLRWDHPERGLIPPLAFVPIAEESGLILHIGRWVLTRACQHAAAWLSDITLPPEFTVSVNVSNRQLEHDRLIAEVASILESSGLPPRGLVVEITESFFMRDLRAAVRRLKALKQLGVRISIDDFGIGFSSLNSLSKLPIDVVKIDKSFTDSLGTRNDAIISAVVDLARAFDLKVVAEGVETEAQRERLVSLGCEFGQGHLFGTPFPAAGIEREFSSRAGTSR